MKIMIPVDSATLSWLGRLRGSRTWAETIEALKPSSIPAWTFTNEDVATEVGKKPPKLLVNFNEDQAINPGDQGAWKAIGVPDTLPVPATRDPYKQPFASTSFWNTPLGANRVLMASPLSTDIGTEEEWSFLDPSAPMRPLENNGQYPASAAHGTFVANIHAEDGRMIRPGDPGYMPNNCCGGLVDADTIQEFQYAGRTQDSYIACGAVRDRHALRGDGGVGKSLAHGGSGLSGVGGCLRQWEGAPGVLIEHVLKLTVNHAYLSKTSNGYRWPAQWADAGYSTPGGPSEYSGSIPPLRMGALVCLRDTFDLNSLTSEFGKRIGQAFKHFGARIVDIGPGTWGGTTLNVESGVAVPVADMQKIAAALCTVTDDSQTSIGGTGARVRPLLPPV